MHSRRHSMTKFNSEKSLDEFQKLSVPTPETFSESMKMMKKMVNHFQAIYDLGFSEGYEAGIKEIEL